MQDKGKSFLPSSRLLALAAVAGLLAGAVAVYMNGDLSGNGETGEIAAIDCSAADAQAATLKPLAKGEIAALIIPAASTELTLPPFNGPDGKAMTFQSLSGKVRLVNLWATWCVPCREEMPALDNLQKAYDAKDFEVVAINIDTGEDDKPRAFLNEIKVTSLAYYRDPSMANFSAMKKQGLAFGLPVTALVDGKGCLLGSMNGPAKWDSADARALIDAALGKTP